VKMPACLQESSCTGVLYSITGMTLRGSDSRATANSKDHPCFFWHRGFLYTYKHTFSL